MRVTVEGNIVWEKIRELSCNKFDDTYEEAVTVIKGEFENKPTIFLFENDGWELAKTIKVVTEEGIVKTMLEANEAGYIQMVCVCDKLLCLWNDIMNWKSILFSI